MCPVTSFARFHMSVGLCYRIINFIIWQRLVSFQQDPELPGVAPASAAVLKVLASTLVAQDSLKNSSLIHLLLCDDRSRDWVPGPLLIRLSSGIERWRRELLSADGGVRIEDGVRDSRLVTWEKCWAGSRDFTPFNLRSDTWEGERCEVTGLGGSWRRVGRKEMECEEAENRDEELVANSAFWRGLKTWNERLEIRLETLENLFEIRLKSLEKSQLKTKLKKF